MPIVLFVAGCHEVNPRSLPPPPDGEELPIVRQVAGTQSNEDRPMQLVIRDAATLSQAPLVDVPVDFSREMLLIVTLGRRLSDQYAVQIDRVRRDGPELAVDYTITVPRPDSPLALSSPYCIAVVPRCDLNVDGFSPIIPRARTGVPEFLRTDRDVPTVDRPLPVGVGRGARRPGTANIRRR